MCVCTCMGGTNGMCCWWFYILSLGEYTVPNKVCSAHCNIWRICAYFASPSRVWTQVGNRGKLLLTWIHVTDTCSVWLTFCSLQDDRDNTPLHYCANLWVDIWLRNMSTTWYKMAEYVLTTLSSTLAHWVALVLSKHLLYCCVAI